jgi:prepilin-type N-terminal cleavage/methylation domain-containing protein
MPISSVGKRSNGSTGFSLCKNTGRRPVLNPRCFASRYELWGKQSCPMPLSFHKPSLLDGDLGGTGFSRCYERGPWHGFSHRLKPVPPSPVPAMASHNRKLSGIEQSCLQPAFEPAPPWAHNPEQPAGKPAAARIGCPTLRRATQVGRQRAKRLAGVTLIEMLVVLLIIALIVGLTFPAMTAGIETLRLNGAARSIAAFINRGLNRSERRQQVVQVTVSRAENALWLRSSQAGFEDRLEMPDGIRIESVEPGLANEDFEARSFLFYPGGTAPAFGVVLSGKRGGERVVRVDPITGVPKIESVAK